MTSVHMAAAAATTATAETLTAAVTIETAAEVPAEKTAAVE